LRFEVSDEFFGDGQLLEEVSHLGVEFGVVLCLLP
jgi:hypothetical protein